ncbi:MAG: glycosyltransferase family 2 protein [Desulfurella sp.]|uniref:glycosyltransferase family 2 protein n=1 Tax=Desulfurella sp. TaxID=1962857 RepID=UPI003D0DDD60
MNVSVVIPTLNAQKTIAAVLLRLRQEDVKDIIIIDSSSDDNTQKIANAFTDRVYVIKRANFNHGLTRNLALDMAKFNIVVFLTQDAILCKDSIAKLIRNFDQKDVAIVYGRQLPHKNADAFSKHLRYFNYPNYSIKKTFDKKDVYGVKLAFNSNSFSAYKKDVVQSLGGFPKLDFGEDVYMAAKVLLSGWAVYYDNKACVYHSHNYSLKEEFERYLAVGKFYKSQNWIMQTFGKTTKEGLNYIIDQFSFIAKSGRFELLPQFLLKDVLKFFAYKIA